jgi:hypothetical protein
LIAVEPTLERAFLIDLTSLRNILRQISNPSIVYWIERDAENNEVVISYGNSDPDKIPNGASYRFPIVAKIGLSLDPELDERIKSYVDEICSDINERQAKLPPEERKQALNQFSSYLKPIIDDGLLVCLHPLVVEQVQYGLYMEEGDIRRCILTDWENFWEPLKAEMLKQLK